MAAPATDGRLDQRADQRADHGRRARLDHRWAFFPLMVGLAALAWVALAWWGRSPSARYLEHESVEDGPGFALLAVAGWTLMTVAMMLPTALPLVRLFERMAARRADGGRLIGLLVAGYLSVWVAFGLAVHALDRALHGAIEQVSWLDARPWVITATTLGLAGAYQFSRLKYRCLEQCRSPLMFISQRWTGRDHARRAFRIGVDHGVFCVGCCWSLMLLMFAVGVGNLAWMFALGVIMAVEKNLPWGRRVSTPVGASLLTAAVVFTAVQLY